MSLVIDASVTMAWCYVDEPSSYASSILDRLEQSRAVVPPVWQLEVANTLLVGERRGRATPAESTSFLDRLQGLPIDVDAQGSDQSLGRVLALGRQYRLSAYDAAYLELALRGGHALATLDTALRSAAVEAGVALVE